MTRPLSFLVLSMMLLSSPASVYAGIVVFDGITAVNKPVQLRALARGRILPEGGKLLHFSVQDNPVGQTLTGGDGYAYREYVPREAGLYAITVSSGDERAEGKLLALKRKTKVILIEIEGGLMDSPFSPEAKKGSIEVITDMTTQHNIIYLTTVLGAELSRKWIEAQDLPPSAILPWTGSDLFDDLQSIGVIPHAIVGSPTTIAEASQKIERRYTFSASEEGTVVDDWDELYERFKSGGAGQ